MAFIKSIFFVACIVAVFGQGFELPAAPELPFALPEGLPAAPGAPTAAPEAPEALLDLSEDGWGLFADSMGQRLAERRRG
jgi:hypothetical protein